MTRKWLWAQTRFSNGSRVWDQLAECSVSGSEAALLRLGGAGVGVADPNESGAEKGVFSIKPN